jgi:hypothetical protein
MNVINLPLKRLCRILTNSRYNMPVDVVSGEQSPRVTGQGYRYETRGGSPIFYPSAYSKKGWSNMVYCNSTISIEVGEEWLEKNAWAEQFCVTTECFKKPIRELLLDELTGYQS